jgi:hypothetical protein
MVIENTDSTIKVRNVAATMAIEDMYLDEDFIREMIKVANDEKSADDVIKEIVQEYRFFV